MLVIIYTVYTIPYICRLYVTYMYVYIYDRGYARCGVHGPRTFTNTQCRGRPYYSRQWRCTSGLLLLIIFLLIFALFSANFRLNLY